MLAARRAQRPADAIAFREVGGARLFLAHRQGRLGAQQACPIGGHAITQVELREGQQVVDVGDDAARRIDPAWQRIQPRHLVLVGAGMELIMANSMRIDDRLVREVEGALQTQRLEEALAHRRLERLARYALDDRSGQTEAGVAVRPERAGRVLLAQLVEGGDCAGESVIAHAEVVEIIAEEAAGMAEQMS